MRMSLTALCDKGPEREVNEDSCLVCQDVSQKEHSVILPRDVDRMPSTAYCPLASEGALLIVADGMGGAAAGDVASQLAVSHLLSLLSDPETLSQTIAQVDTILKQHAIEHPETTGMGTTLVLAWVVGSKAHIAWVGDSRCYLFRPGEGLRRVTNDHSYVQELIDSGQLSADEALTHPESNIITRCLGDTDIPSHADTTTVDLQPNDLLLLCSDGLCGYCTDDEISRIVLNNYTDISGMSHKLLDAALATGGYDNITIALASLISDDAQKPVLPSRSFFDWFRRLLQR